MIKFSKFMPVFFLKPTTDLPDDLQERRNRLKQQLIATHAEGSVSLARGLFTDKRKSA